MLVTAAVIGIGMYMLFVDLPKEPQKFMLRHSWIPHIIVFAVLFWLHGSTGEGAAMAGIGAVITRTLMVWQHKREVYAEYISQNKPPVNESKKSLTFVWILCGLVALAGAML